MEITNELIELITDDYCEAIDNTNREMYDYDKWDYETWAVERLVCESISAKKNIIDVLSKHPLWDERHLLIAIPDTYYSRDIDIACCKNIWDKLHAVILNRSKYLRNNDMKDDAEKYDFSISALYRLLNCADSYEQIINTNTAAVCNQYLAKAKLKTKLSGGQKRSKALGKIITDGMFETDINTAFPYYLWSAMRAHYGDAINPLEVEKWTIISVNPVDFWNSSNGDSWASCHNPNKETHSGCNCSGGISYGLDNCSFVMYTVDSSFDGDAFEFEPKHTRAMGFWSPENTYFGLLKVYPYSYETHFNSFKEILQRVFSECLDVPNLWKINTKHESVKKIMRKTPDSTCYPDWHYINNGQGTPIQKAICWLSETTDPSELEPLHIGAEPICIYCGNRHDCEDSVSCCRGVRTCDNCGQSLHDEDDERYSEYLDKYGCYECMTWCNWLDDYFWSGDGWTYVENIGEDLPDVWIRDNSENFVECESCGELLYIGNRYCSDDFAEYEDENGDYHYYCCGCCPELEECVDEEDGHVYYKEIA